jgi:superfamily II DNA or RNA helicase
MYNDYDYYDNIRMKFLPRDEDQTKALQFTLGKAPYQATLTKSQLCINLNTGKGKTYVAIGTIASTGTKSIIITYAKTVLTQWKKCFLDYTNIQEKAIYEIDGTPSIYRLLTKSPKEIKQIRIFLCTHGTLKSYGDSHGWDKVTELFKIIRVGYKFYDEAHTNFSNMLQIDFYTSVYKSFYLTATPARSNNEEDKIYQASFKNVLAIDLFHKSDPHTHYIAMRYNSRPPAYVISNCKGKYGLDRNKYTNYIVTNDKFKMMATVVLDFIFRNILKLPGDKMIIYIGTNQAILEFEKWMKEQFPMFANTIGVFTSIVSDQQKQMNLSNKIILTTTKSAGAAIDIKGLKCTLVLAEPFKSEVLARQTLGRTRDDDTYYIEVVDKGFSYCNKYFLAKRPVFNKYAMDSKLVDFLDLDLETEYSKVMDMRMASTDVQPAVVKTKPFTIASDLTKPFIISVK